MNVNNLLDKRYYRTIGGALRGDCYGTPRSISVTLSHHFP